MLLQRAFSAIAAILIFSTAQLARAAEGGFSLYLPGLAGDIALAQSTEPGDLQVANTLFIQSGDVGAAVLQGRVNADLDLTLVLDIVSASYAFEREVLGARYSIGGAIPFGYAKLKATITIPGLGSRDADRDDFNIADIVIVPLELTWSFDDFSLQLGHAIVAPTGGYDEDDVVNVGLNHWGFDTTLAATYLNPDTGTEFSVAPGFLVNTENEDTDYRSGSEFHLDFTANQFLTETFAIGIRGYYYRQLTGDSGSGALLGDFEGESVAIGPGFVWFPKFAEGKLAVLGKWMRDLSSTNRFESDFGTLTVAWTF
jgi:hypothetical protein